MLAPWVGGICLNSGSLLMTNRSLRAKLWLISRSFTMDVKVMRHFSISLPWLNIAILFSLLFCVV